MSNLMITANELLPNESQTESCRSHPSLATCVSSYSPVQLDSTEDLQTWLVEAFPASPSLLPESDSEPMTSEICGPQQLTPYARLDPATASLRTFQACLLPGISSESYATLPKAGIACDGVVYLRPSWEQTIGEIDSGLLLPTPTASEDIQAKRLGGASEIYTDKTGKPRRRMATGKSASMGLGKMAAINMWPTPRASDYKGATSASAMEKAAPRGHGPNLPEHVAEQAGGGKLNPTFVEWLMNWPIGWTSLEPLRKEYFDDWQQRTQGGTAGVHSGAMRCMWWDADPSETPYRPQPIEQRAGEYSNSMPGVPQGNAPTGWDMGQGQGDTDQVRDMRDGVSTEAQPQERESTVREPGMSQGEGEIISRVTVGVVNRVDRLKAIGNGQVSMVAATAWRLLTEGL